MLYAFQTKIITQYEESGGTLPTLGVANAGQLLDRNANIAAKKPLNGIQWFYNPPYHSASYPTLLLEFSRDNLAAPVGSGAPYLRLFLVENNGILSWQCYNHQDANYQFKSVDLPSHCKQGNP